MVQFKRRVNLVLHYIKQLILSISRRNSANKYVLLAGYSIVICGTLATLSVKLLGIGTSELTYQKIAVAGILTLSIMVVAHIVARRSKNSPYTPFIVSTLTVVSFACYISNITSAKEFFCLFFINIMLSSLYFDYRVVLSTTGAVYIAQTLLLWLFPVLVPENAVTVLATRYLIILWICLSALVVAVAGNRFLKLVKKEKEQTEIKNKQMRVVAEHIQETSEEISNLMRNIHGHVNVVREIYEQINEGIQEISDGAQNQASEAEDASQVVSSAMGSIEEINTRTNNLNYLVEKLTLDVEEGNKVVETQTENMMATAEANEKVTEAIEYLTKNVESIGDIIKTIYGIASQTKMLALNAAIEAARAGENGRGFAVVSDEIRKLAGQSTDATSDIRDIIKKIQDSAKETVEKMIISKNQFQQQQELAKQASDQFNNIGKSNLTVSEDLRKFIEFIEKINGAMNQVVLLIQQNSTTAEELAASTQEMLAITEDQNQQMSRVAEAVDRVMEVVERLKVQGEQLDTA